MADDTQRSGCPITCALDLIGDRWTLVVVRDLVFRGVGTFSELAAPEGIATNVLADRLDRLVRSGLAEKRPDPEDGRRRIYAPTERARALVPVLLELAIWGADHCGGSAQSELVEAARADREGLIERLRASWDEAVV